MHAHFPLSPEAARSYLEKHAPLMLEAVERDGHAHVSELLRNVDEGAYKRITTGDLTEVDRQEPNGFYIARHAAWVLAEALVPSS